MASPTTFARSSPRPRELDGRAHGAIVLIAALLAAAPAAAQEAGVDRTAAARALFEEGLELLDAEQWEQAADRFQRALALRPSPQITYNLTSALVPLGRLVRASELLRQVTLDPTATPEVRQAAETRRAQIAPRIASLTVVPSAELERADFFLDERPLDLVLIGVAVPIDPGRHTVTARLQGREVAHRAVDLLDGEAVEVSLELSRAAGEVDAGPVAAPAPARSETERRRPSSVARRWWFWTILGAVVVGGAVAAGVAAGTREPSWPDGVQGPGETIYLGGSQ